MLVKYTVSEFLSAKGSFSSIDKANCVHYARLMVIGVGSDLKDTDYCPIEIIK